MCGIAGVIDFGNSSNLPILKNMTEALHHRGPDDAGYFTHQLNNSFIGLGHRRLSILDLSSNGHQPMTYNNLTVAFNGEIYNFREIRKELNAAGHVFESDSDTEVLLKAYLEWGDSSVHRFIGMFAIALFDRSCMKLTLIRDRAGVKPLYWYFNKGLFLFGSELKCFSEHPDFQKKVNHSALALYLQYGYIPEPHSIFINTHKLKAGHFLYLDVQTGVISHSKYWDVVDCYAVEKIKISEEEAVEEVEGILRSACEYRMVSDVPVGMFLSGGYDSSAVTAILQSNRTQKLKTFSIGFHEKNFNEAHHALKIAEYLGTDHTELYCTQGDALNLIDKIPVIWDEPFGDPSAIPTLLVSQIARNHVKVSLSADGGDETFAGYEKYQQVIKLQNVISKIPLKKQVSAIMGLINIDSLDTLNKIPKFNHRYKKIQQALSAKSPIDLLSLAGGVFTPLELVQLLKKKPKQVETSFDGWDGTEAPNEILDKLLLVDYKTYQLDDILVKVDRATMSFGLEGREPLLDHRLIDFVAKLDVNLKINKGNKKYLLKQVTHKYLPKALMERPKMGFSVPIVHWFRDELKDYLLTYLNRERLEDGGYFDSSYVINLRDRYLAGMNVNVNQLWLLLMFEMWRERWA